MSSPYRLPLLKFLNQHPRKSLEYLFKNLHRRRVSALLLSLLKYPEGEPLRRYLHDNVDFFDMWTFHYDKQTAEQSLAPPVQPSQPQNQPTQPVTGGAAAGGAVAPMDSNAPAAAPQADGFNGGMVGGNNGGGASGLPPLESPNPPPSADGSVNPLASRPLSASTDATMTSSDQSSTSAPASSTPAPSPIPGGAAVGSAGSQPSKESEAALRAAHQAAGEQEERIIQGINLVHVLSSIKADFISPRILTCLSEVWESKGRISRLLREEALPIHFVEESKTLVLCLLTYSNSHRDDITVLWKLLSAFRLRSLVDFTFLAEHLDVELNASYSLAEKRHVLRQLLRYVENPGTSQSSKSRAFKHVIRPMLKHSLKARTVRSPQVIREEQMKLLEERRSKEEEKKDTLDVEVRKEGKEVELQASPAPASDGSSRMDLGDEKAGSAGEGVLEESASYAAAALENHIILPPVWQEDDLLDTDMTDSIVHTFTSGTQHRHTG